jgi:hypothetical protein
MPLLTGKATSFGFSTRTVQISRAPSIETVGL